MRLPSKVIRIVGWVAVGVVLGVAGGIAIGIEFASRFWSRMAQRTTAASGVLAVRSLNLLDRGDEATLRWYLETEVDSALVSLDSGKTGRSADEDVVIERNREELRRYRRTHPDGPGPVPHALREVER